MFFRCPLQSPNKKSYMILLLVLFDISMDLFIGFGFQNLPINGSFTYLSSFSNVQLLTLPFPSL